MGRTKDLAVEWEIADLMALASSNAASAKYENEFSELTGPCVSSGMYAFEFLLTYGVQGKSCDLRQDQQIGIMVRRSDTSPGLVFAKVAIQIVNSSTDKSIAKEFRQYRAFEQKARRGWSGSATPETSIKDLTLRNLSDPSKGWLFSGAIRIICKISIMMGTDTIESVEDAYSTQKDVCDSFKTLLESERYADVTLHVKGEKMSVHSVILAARSPVFDAMLSSGMKESRAKQIKIEGLEPEAVRQLVHFLYTGDVKEDVLVDDDAVASLLHAAHMYGASALVTMCTRALSLRFQIETVSKQLQLAHLISCEHFKAQCLEFMRHQMPEIMQSESYKHLVQTNPSLLSDVIAAMAGPPLKKRRADEGEIS